MLYCSICNAELKWWCTTQDWEYFTSTLQYSYFKCIECNSICIHPLPVGELTAIYPPHYYSFLEPSRNGIFQIKEWLDRRYFIRLLKKLPGAEIHVLDIGGGNGWLLDQIVQSCSSIRSTTIIDINEACRPVAEKNGHTFHLSRIEDFKSFEKFDLILMLNLIEHVENPGEVLAKISTLLTDTGVCLIKTPNAQSLDARLFDPLIGVDCTAPDTGPFIQRKASDNRSQNYRYPYNTYSLHRALLSGLIAYWSVCLEKSYGSINDL